MTTGVSIAGEAEWLADRDLQKLLAVLCDGGNGARIVGGAIRNTLFGEPVGDIDIATTIPPDETIRRAKAAGYKAVPTGYEHGTITVIAGQHAYEVTTLRADVDTDGRRATVRFGKDWTADAERRDFTINALYADASGMIHDPVDGLRDIGSRTLRFIGDPVMRIGEDYLRILRFFRFFAWYGHGRPEAEGLKACARMKDGLDQLSAERVWAELKKLLQAPDCSRALLWMRQTGVLSRVLPESEKWGIDAIPGLIAAEQAFGWPPDPLLRIEAMVRPDPDSMEKLADRLRLSRQEKLRLMNWSKVPVQTLLGDETAETLYRFGQFPCIDVLRLETAKRYAVSGSEGDAADVVAIRQKLAFAESWEKPKFPVRGRDILALGVEDGPRVGEILGRLETGWIESNFSAPRDMLIAQAQELAGTAD